MASLAEMASMYVDDEILQFKQLTSVQDAFSRWSTFSVPERASRIFAYMLTALQQYHWVSILAPPRMAKFLSYITGKKYFKYEFHNADCL
jgi:hypothetical protein